MTKQSEMCPDCGGLIMEPGKVYGWAGKVCGCWKGPQQTPRVPAEGWRCPNCGAGNAPHVSQCPCTVAYPGRRAPFRCTR